MEKPEVGMGATVNHWSDRTACTIIYVSPSAKKIVLQADRAVRTDNHGPSDSQSYEYSRDSEGRIFEVSLRKDGTYRVVKSTLRVTIGVRRQYYDYSF